MTNISGSENCMNVAVTINMDEPRLPEIIIKPEEYKESLRFAAEVRALTDEIDLDTSDTTLLFGEEPIMDFSRVFDELVSYIKFVESEELDNIEIFLKMLLNI